jgi:hypothetical protein
VRSVPEQATVTDASAAPDATAAAVATTAEAQSPDPRTSRAAVEYCQREVISEHFFSWAQHCLLDDVARHVHEVVRRSFVFYHENRAAPFERFLESPQCVEAFRNQLEAMTGHKRPRHTYNGSHGSHGSHGTGGSTSASAQSSVSGSLSSPSHSVSAHPRGSASTARSVTSPPSSHSSHTSGSRQAGDSFVTKMRHLTGQSTQRERKHNKHQQVLSKDGALVSELRNVIVLFISVRTGTAEVFLDPTRTVNPSADTRVPSQPQDQSPALIQTCKVDTFHFLTRTVAEIEADKRLINQFQSCMEVMTQVFRDKGGQLRQFIVDDKGGW